MTAKKIPPLGRFCSAANLAVKFSSAPYVSMKTSAVADAGTASLSIRPFRFSGFFSTSTFGTFMIRNRISAITIETAANRNSIVNPM